MKGLIKLMIESFPVITVNPSHGQLHNDHTDVEVCADFRKKE